MEWSKMTGNSLDGMSKGNNLEIYVTDPGQVQENELKTDLYCKLGSRKRPNTICHVDFMFEDSKRCQAFYEKSFGWKFQQWQDDYFLFSTPDIFNTLQGGFQKKSNKTVFGNSCIIYIEVADINVALTAIKSNGAKNATEIQKIGTFGLSSFFDDTEGNRVGIYQSLY